VTDEKSLNVDLDSQASNLGRSAPNRDDEEWANALTHGLSACLSLVAGSLLVLDALPRTGLAIACAAYAVSALSVFVFSTLSHSMFRQPLLDTLRAWDQATIYAMISGTYTPIAFAYAPPGTRTWLLVALWVAAFSGLASKAFLRHRINGISTLSYLLLGWLPAIPLAGHVPRPLVLTMVAGGVLYTIGVAVLVNDHRARYTHAVWHLLVLSAASCHFYGIWHYVVRGT
jgi:hemolysin III